ncbi:MAG: response regulator transcription factor [Lachnospiraceae bacterium]|nr:response regulator transcription factor [Lachnospiraceae bacterium]
METVFIADDEQIIREGLKHIIDWANLGFTICGEAGSGEEALDGIMKLNPSLVLMDIRMPKLLGTDIIRNAREQGFSGKFIIISGYSDFSYAQTAIRHGVEFYLTKPIDEEELLEAVTRIRELLAKEQESSTNIDLFRKKAKNVILHELVTGIYSPESKNALPDLIADLYQVVIYEEFYGTASPAYSFAELLKVANRGNHSFEHLTIDSREIFLLKGSFALRKFEAFLTHYELREYQEKSPLDTLFLAYGRPVKNMDQIYLSYEEALLLCRRRFFCTQGQHALGYEELPFLNTKVNEIDKAKLKLYQELLTDSLKSFNRRKVAESLHELEVFLYNVKDDIKSVKRFLTDLYFQIKEKINIIYSSAAIPFPSNSEIIERIDNSFYLYEIIIFISEQTDLIINATGAPSRDSVLYDILYYIDHNYQSNIKLETIAPLFGYNSAYLGKIFNKATGESFNTYIDHRRIEYSKQLLIENKLKVYEIAEQVGYKNVDYFHKKFKKYVGVSPAEYRKADIP